MGKLKLDKKLDKVQEHIESYVEERVRIYTSSVRRFFKEVKGTCHSKKAVKRAFKLLLEKGSMPLHTFHEVCGVEEERFIEIISNIEPHPFYVNPEHRTIQYFNTKLISTFCLILMAHITMYARSSAPLCTDVVGGAYGGRWASDGGV